MDTEELIALFSENFPAVNLRQRVSWRELSSLGAGHALVPAVAEPENDLQLACLLRFCKERDIRTMIVGGGCNIVGMDTTFPGLLIRLCQGEFMRVQVGRHHLTAGAGATLSEVLKTAAMHGFGGASALAGIPGSVGGILRMNAGAGGLDIAHLVVELAGLDQDGSSWQADADDIIWGNRETNIPEDVIITAAIFLFPERIDPETELLQINNKSRERRQKDPSGRSAGCVFRNPAPELSAGQLMDNAGLKGLSGKQVKFSEKHANWLINTGNASGQAVLELMIKARQEVADKSAIYLQAETVFADYADRKKLLSSPQVPQVLVVMGGNSRERTISIESGTAVAKALRQAGYRVLTEDIKSPEISQPMCQADLIFPVLHGGFGENGEFQEMLIDKKISFVGCDTSACRIIMDKVLSKKLMDERGIPTAAWAVLAPDENLIPEKLSLPLAVKPPCEGSSFGISLVFELAEWAPALAKSRSCEPDRVLVEQYIKGREITVGIIAGKALPTVEIQYPGQLYDFDAKYTHEQGETLYHCPPQTVPEEVQKRAQAIAMDYANAVNAADLIRVDMIVRDGDDAIFVLEGNSMPGFTASSLLPKAAANAGIPFAALCAKLVETARKKACGET